MLSLYGKLPTAGDFLTIEVPRPILRPVEDWLAASVASARENVEGDWQTVFDAGPAWNFWIGDKVMGRRMAGVMRPSKDRVGRRFPVVLFASSETRSEVTEAPVIDDDTELYDGLRQELDFLGTQQPDAISERLKMVVARDSGGIGEPAGGADPVDNFWAMAPEAGDDGWHAMIDEARYVDHAQATSGRSYWWNPGSDTVPPSLYATNGMPDPRIFSWFVSGLGAAGFANAGQNA